MTKYRNQQNISTFGKYTDPYGERRGAGEVYSTNQVIEFNLPCQGYEGYDHNFDMWDKYIGYAMKELL